MKYAQTILSLLISTSLLEASSSSIFWTVCTTDVTPTGTCFLGVADYFTVPDRHGHRSFLAPDLSLELGLFTWNNLSSEIGFDYLGGLNNPWYFNGKVGMAQGALFCHSPSWSLGLFNVGTKMHGSRQTNQNIVDFILGTELPQAIGGRLFAGVFAGNKPMGEDKQGWMVAYARSFCPATSCNKQDYFKWIFSADYASGKNTLGGGGFALTHFFNPDVSIQVGPVWFNSKELYGDWKLGVSVGISFPVYPSKNLK